MFVLLPREQRVVILVVLLLVAFAVFKQYRDKAREERIAPVSTTEQALMTPAPDTPND